VSSHDVFAFRPYALVILALTVAVSAAVTAQSIPRPNSRIPTSVLPLRIAEAKADNEHSVTSSACILVQPDGRFHVERRRLSAPSTTATLKIYESTLDSAQLQELITIVGKVEESAAPPYEDKGVGFNNAPWFATVDISIGDASRRFGYWSWDSRNAGPQVNADVRKGWLESEAALKPLLNWFHRTEGQKLPLSDSGSNQCLQE
jgi:hypothetical protein